MQMSLRIFGFYILTSRLQNSSNCANYLSSICGHSIRQFVQIVALISFDSHHPSSIFAILQLMCAFPVSAALYVFSSVAVLLLLSAASLTSALLSVVLTSVCSPSFPFPVPFPVLLPCPRLPFSLPLTRMWRSFDAFCVVLWVVFGGQPHF